MYPINSVLKCRVEELGITKKEIAEKMGYKNLIWFAVNLPPLPK